MSPYVQGYCQALVKLGLSPSAGAAAGGLGAAGLKPQAPGAAAKGIKPLMSPKPPKPAAPGATQYNADPKMLGENAWQHAQKDLDTSESRTIGKVDRSQSATPLATGSV
jgi:hypothetical protein